MILYKGALTTLLQSSVDIIYGSSWLNGLAFDLSGSNPTWVIRAYVPLGKELEAGHTLSDGVRRNWEQLEES